MTNYDDPLGALEEEVGIAPKKVAITASNTNSNSAGVTNSTGEEGIDDDDDDDDDDDGQENNDSDNDDTGLPDDDNASGTGGEDVKEPKKKKVSEGEQIILNEDKQVKVRKFDIRITTSKSDGQEYIILTDIGRALKRNLSPIKEKYVNGRKQFLVGNKPILGYTRKCLTEFFSKLRTDKKDPSKEVLLQEILVALDIKAERKLPASKPAKKKNMDKSNASAINDDDENRAPKQKKRKKLQVAEDDDDNNGNSNERPKMSMTDLLDENNQMCGSLLVVLNQAIIHQKNLGHALRAYKKRKQSNASDE
jgi:hypothetical protein